MSWRLTYLLLLIVRFYFALSPSYIHPDEHFQGPEVLAGEIFGWNSTKTWEFTSETPIRSILPLWLAYGFPMTILRWIYGMNVDPTLAYYCLRMFFCLVSFSLEDWALQELGSTPKIKAHYLLAVASSYVTWTYQTHTFSNSVETVLVAWSLVLIRRISFRNFGHSNHFWSSSLLGCLVAIGVFNRITFPAFLILPAWYLVPQFIRFPSSLFFILFAGLLTSLLTVYIDTSYYESPRPVFTPLNNLLYNVQPDNLAKHGLHARYTHVLINLPMLLGPSILIIRPQFSITFLAAVSGTLVLSVFQHQEARFLLPAVPLFLTATSRPNFEASPLRKWTFTSAFVAFNAILAIVFGILHQGGVVPAQTQFVSRHAHATQDVVWWRTYSPPDWLLGPHPVGFRHRGGVAVDDVPELVAYAAGNTTASRDLRVWDMMGSDHEAVGALLGSLFELQRKSPAKQILFVAPVSASNLYRFLDNPDYPFFLKRQWTYLRHINLDDIGVDYDEALYYSRQRGVTDLSWLDKKKLMFTQNRPGICIWSLVPRE